MASRPRKRVLATGAGHTLCWEPERQEGGGRPALPAALVSTKSRGQQPAHHLAAGSHGPWSAQELPRAWPWAHKQEGGNPASAGLPGRPCPPGRGEPGPHLHQQHGLRPQSTGWASHPPPTRETSSANGPAVSTVAGTVTRWLTVTQPHFPQEAMEVAHLGRAQLSWVLASGASPMPSWAPSSSKGLHAPRHLTPAGATPAGEDPGQPPHSCRCVTSWGGPRPAPTLRGPGGSPGPEKLHSSDQNIPGD